MANDELSIQYARAHVEMRRETEAGKISLFYLPYYEALCDLLQNTFWAPYSSMRTPEQQQKLYLQGRSEASKAKGEAIITNALAGDSPHNWGCATDWAEFRPEFRGQDVWNRANWEQFGSAVTKVGLVWGGNFKSINDKPHCELPIQVSWKVIGDMYRKKGAERAIELIGMNMVKFK